MAGSPDSPPRVDTAPAEPDTRTRSDLDPRPTRYTIGDPGDELAQIRIWADGELWHVTDYYGQWLDEQGRWEWPPRRVSRGQGAVWRAARQWDLDMALGYARGQASRGAR